MTAFTFQSNTFNTSGELPAKGTQAPDFCLVGADLAEHRLADYAGNSLILNIFPSVDTPTCATSTKRFNTEAAARQNVKVLCVSMDLPFAHGRFCSAEGINNVTNLSAFRSQEFGVDYGVMIIDGPLKGLLARAIVVIDANCNVILTQLVADLKDEPDYQAALQVT